ncbi:MAG: HNH endonuclease [Shimia sp.]
MPYLKSGLRCEICGGLLHKKSIHVHYIRLKSQGGSGDMANAGFTRPYCNSITQS